MKTKFLQNEFKYDGSQLRGQFAYFEHAILGNSAVAWIGPCDVDPKFMVDGEDLLANEKIAGNRMAHFIIEIFNEELLSGVLFQRLFASIAMEVILEISKEKRLKLIRIGDDLYWNKKKLSISIATKSPLSVLVHFAVNVTTAGVPVKACGLEELKVNPNKFINLCLERIKNEFQSCFEATQKVRPVI